MRNLFDGASDFNHHLSKWDVSAVTDMRYMFTYASAFQYKLCGFAWVNSKARKDDVMFYKSGGSISSTMCTTGMLVRRA